MNCTEDEPEQQPQLAEIGLIISFFKMHREIESVSRERAAEAMDEVRRELRTRRNEFNRADLAMARIPVDSLAREVASLLNTDVAITQQAAATALLPSRVRAACETLWRFKEKHAIGKPPLYSTAAAAHQPAPSTGPSTAPSISVKIVGQR